MGAVPRKLSTASEPSSRKAPNEEEDEGDEEELDRYGYMLPGSSCSSPMGRGNDLHQTRDVRMSTFTLTTMLHTEKERPVTCNNVMNSILDL